MIGMNALDEAARPGVAMQSGIVSAAGQAGADPATAGQTCPASTEAGQPPSVLQQFQRWIVIHHRPDDGARVRIGVRREGFEVHWPREVHRVPRRDDVLRPFLPGYMFAYALNARASWHRIKAKVPNVVGIVGVREHGAPVYMPMGHVETLIERAGGLLTGAIPAPEDAALTWDAGMPLRIVRGSLAGASALFQAERGSQRIMVLLTMLGVPRAVILERDAVEAE